MKRTIFRFLERPILCYEMIYITYVLIYNLYKYIAKTSTTISATAKTKRDRGFCGRRKKGKKVHIK